MRFEHQYDETTSKITMELDRDADLDEVRDEFRIFLFACGFAQSSIDKYFPTEETQEKTDSGEQ